MQILCRVHRVVLVFCHWLCFRLPLVFLFCSPIKTSLQWQGCGTPPLPHSCCSVPSCSFLLMEGLILACKKKKKQHLWSTIKWSIIKQSMLVIIFSDNSVLKRKKDVFHTKTSSNIRFTTGFQFYCHHYESLCMGTVWKLFFGS